jgi:uncharacterized RDD family membrane protein YckC
MDPKLKNIKIWRFLAFIYDIPFILLVSFTIYMLFGLIFKLDSEGFQSIMIYLLLAVVALYLFFGELMFKNTFGKYLFGIKVVDDEGLGRPPFISFLKRGLLKILLPVEGLVLLFSGSKKRLGDLWAKSSVINKETSKLKPTARLLLGIATLVALFFSFSISMGVAARRTDFYEAGADYITANNPIKITGLPKEVSQNRDSIYFGVPVSIENQARYAQIYLVKTSGQWNVYNIKLLNGHLGASFSFNITSDKK